MDLLELEKCVSVTNQHWTVTHFPLEAYVTVMRAEGAGTGEELAMLEKRGSVEWIKNQVAMPGVNSLIKYVQELLDQGVGNC